MKSLPPTPSATCPADLRYLRLEMLDDNPMTSAPSTSWMRALQRVGNGAFDQPWLRWGGGLAALLLVGTGLLYLENRSGPAWPEDLAVRWWPRMTDTVREAFLRNATTLACRYIARGAPSATGMPDALDRQLVKLIADVDESYGNQTTLHAAGSGLWSALDLGTHRNHSGNRAAELWAALQRAEQHGMKR